MNKEGNTRRIASLLLILLLLMAAAEAEKLTFPEGLRQIEAEAFMGGKDITAVELPNSLTALGARAFANCRKLKAIRIPAGVTSLGEDFLDGCPSDVLIKTTADSAALRYAQSHQLDYQAGTKYRALLVGQTYKNNRHHINLLRAPANDVKAMKRGLESFRGTPYSVTTKMELSAQGILDAIGATFAGATERDVSLFFYTGHGFDDSGELVGIDNEGVSAEDLRNTLDTIPGRKIVLINACFSGNMIGRDARAAQGSGDGSVEDFVNSFIGAFSFKPKDTDLRGSEYFVITSASGSESCWELYSNNNDGRGIFTWAFLIGCGYDFVSGKTNPMYADSNSNGVITLQEAYAFTRSKALSLLTGYTYNGEPTKQYAQVYPQNCNWFGIFRK